MIVEKRVKTVVTADGVVITLTPEEQRILKGVCNRNHTVASAVQQNRSEETPSYTEFVIFLGELFRQL